MQTNLHLFFKGNCREVFAFYEKTFNSKPTLTMTYGEAPLGSPIPDEMKAQIMHIAMPLGSITLMGADSPPERYTPTGGFRIALTIEDEAEVKRLFTELSEGGSVQMPLMPVFWSPLFGMCVDKFGVGWMLGTPGPQPQEGPKA